MWSASLRISAAYEKGDLLPSHGARKWFSRRTKATCIHDNQNCAYAWQPKPHVCMTTNPRYLPALKRYNADAPNNPALWAQWTPSFYLLASASQTKEFRSPTNEAQGIIHVDITLFIFSEPRIVLCSLVHKETDWSHASNFFPCTCRYIEHKCSLDLEILQ